MPFPSSLFASGMSSCRATIGQALMGAEASGEAYGHVLDDGPAQTALRFCETGVVLGFDERMGR
jgi:peptide methionine sulfoxide reductase MsrB